MAGSQSIRERPARQPAHETCCSCGEGLVNRIPARGFPVRKRSKGSAKLSQRRTGRIARETATRLLRRENPAGPAFSEQQARDLGGAFLFSGQEQEKRLDSLSGGERSRARLAGLLASAKNLLILDYLNSKEWDWERALDRFRENRQEFATQKKRSVGFGTLETAANGHN